MNGLRSTSLSGSMHIVNFRIQTGCPNARRAAAPFNITVEPVTLFFLFGILYQKEFIFPRKQPTGSLLHNDIT